jgi:uncharacterized membrane protein
MSRPPAHRALRHVRTSLWFVPVVCVLIGAALSFGTIALDKAFDYKLVPEWLTGDSDAAIAILSTVAASMVSLAALVLTITMVVVQLAMGQFSPRIVQTILRDKPSQIAIGLFVATFVHSMLALREVRSGVVPGLAIVVAYLLVVISIVVLVLYVHHIGRSLRVASLIELVGTGTRRVVDQQYPDVMPGAAEVPHDVIAAPRSGVVSFIAHEDLVETARGGDCVLELLPALGAFVPAGAPLFRVHGTTDKLSMDRVTEAISLGLERTLEQDVAYGMRMLVDMAERALSDSPFLDPTTAVQAIDRLHDCLRQLATREFPDGRYFDETGALRLCTPVMSWDAYVALAFDEIRMAGARSPQVTRRLLDALDDLETVVPVDRLDPLREQRQQLVEAVRDAAPNDEDASFGLVGDRQGIGVHAGRYG